VQAGHIGTAALAGADARNITGYVVPILYFGYPSTETAREHANGCEDTALWFGWEFLARLGELCPELADADGDPVDDLPGTTILRNMAR
jgi:hypothetical protein